MPIIRDYNFKISYNHIDYAQSATDISHPYISAALITYYKTIQSLNLSCMSSLPSGTGLGSSGSFAVALVESLETLEGNSLNAYNLFYKAWQLECIVHGEDIGFQDHLHAVYNGFSRFSVTSRRDKCTSFNVCRSELSLPSKSLNSFFQTTFLVYLSGDRQASAAKHASTSNSQSSLSVDQSRSLFTGRSSKIDRLVELLHNDVIDFSKIGNLIFQDCQKKLRNYFSSSTARSVVSSIVGHPGCFGLRPLGAAEAGFAWSLVMSTADVFAFKN